MKKQLILSLCFFGLAACSINENSNMSTLADIFVWGNPDKNANTTPAADPVKYVNVPVVEKNIAEEPAESQSWLDSLSNIFSFGKKEEVAVKYVDAATGEEVAAVDQGYSLAKRGDRYADAKYIITPQVYGIVASRTANKMLTEAPAIFAENKNAPLYIADTVQIDRYLPDGPDAGGKAAKEILYGSKMFNIVTKKESADYVLESSINNINTPEIPVILYEMKLYDAKGKEVGRWSDTIRQVQNDDGSWW